ncbi:MAG: hypothetical protein NDJ92_20135 [Thermoanaerobaculia bacterium]|nr:hypothetical protein [Thermoanaerobaculia bacterium]
MVSLSALWLPILLSGVAVFIVSSIIHMALPIHKNDYSKLPDEDHVLDSMRAAGVGQGAYMFPHCGSHKDMGSPEMKEKMEKGPMGIMLVMPRGGPAMGKSLTLWFLYSLLISFMSAYLASRFLTPGTHYLAVFRHVGTTAFLAYGIGQLSDSIWKAQPWSSTIKNAFDGLAYALVTAGVFGWLWPK